MSVSLLAPFGVGDLERSQMLQQSIALFNIVPSKQFDWRDIVLST